jgi:excisionase family DNA binding protein
MSEPMLLSRKEVARALGISLRLIDTLVARGELRVRRIGRRTLVERRECEKFARRDHQTQG